MTGTTVESRPLTPQEMLARYADLHRKWPVGVSTKAGRSLEAALAAFLSDVSGEGVDEVDIVHDLAIMLARTVVAASTSFHNGRACPDCICTAARVIGSEISREMFGLQDSANSGGGLH